MTILCCCFHILICENGKKTEIRAVIKYFVNKGMRAKEIHADFQNTLEDSALSYSTVVKWISEFKFGQESLDLIRVVDCQKCYYPRIYHKSA